MLLPDLRAEVFEANLELVRAGLVLFTFGNASGIDRESGLVAIKPSGVDYEKMQASDIVVTDLKGNVVDGHLNPSTDLKTHLVLYTHFPNIGGVVHTHSLFATSWAQACRSIPAFGTTHADYFRGEVPITRMLSDEEIEDDYVLNTGLAICELFRDLDPEAIPGALVAGHAPFCWGKCPTDAAHNAIVLEQIAQMAMCTLSINPACVGVSDALLNRHYCRKHGASATYGQPEP
jgi:L-ribulose-5-phosphate 4-epimerase